MSKLDPIDDGSCKGYVITLGKNKGKLSRHMVVARQACEAAHGPPPPEYVVRHLCVNDSNVGKRGEDSFICVNPEHIEWNTYKQNGLDAAHNISTAMKGKTPWNKGKTSSSKTKEKQSIAMKGKKLGPGGNLKGWKTRRRLKGQ